MTDEKIVKWMQSEEGRLALEREINKTTWDVGLPKVYMDEEGFIIKHYKCGLKVRLEEKKDDLGSNV